MNVDVTVIGGKKIGEVVVIVEPPVVTVEVAEHGVETGQKLGH